MPTKPPKTPACRDPCDVSFLQLAVAGKADCLVTGDLRLAPQFTYPIVTAEQLLGALQRG